MTLATVVREAARSARAALVPTSLVAVPVAMKCATTRLTVGRRARGAADGDMSSPRHQAGRETGVTREVSVRLQYVTM